LILRVTNVVTIPSLRHRLSFVTEQVAMHTNQTFGALLNATFGNAPELLISTAALRAGFYRVVQLTLLGSILTNLLLVFGCACVVGGSRYKVQELRMVSGNVSIGMLYLSTAGLVLPAALKLSNQTMFTGDGEAEAELQFSRFNSLVMAAMYVGYLFFQLHTHKEEFEDCHGASDSVALIDPQHLRPPSALSNPPLNGASSVNGAPLRRLLRNTEIASNRSVSSARVTNNDADRCNRPVSSIEMSGLSRNEVKTARPRRKSFSDVPPTEDEHNNIFRPQPQSVISKEGSYNVRKRSGTKSISSRGEDGDETGDGSADGESQEEFELNEMERQSLMAAPVTKIKLRNSDGSEGMFVDASEAGFSSDHGAIGGEDDVDSEMQMTFRSGIVWLFAITLCISAMSDIIVQTIDGFAFKMRLSEVFTALVVVPFFSNIAEQTSAILFAYRNEMDLCVGITVGSAIQISLFVLPGTVLIGWVFDRSMSLFFQGFETCCLLMGVLSVGAVLQGGTSNWLTGFFCIGVYSMIAAGFWCHQIEDLSVDEETILRNITSPDGT
jgi:Ca2+/H+ antiporter